VLLRLALDALILKRAAVDAGVIAVAFKVPVGQFRLRIGLAFRRGLARLEYFTGCAVS
jgi:hypothetical protein